MRRLRPRVIVAMIATAFLATLLLIVFRSQHQTFTLEFTEAKGLHVGDSVTVLDVPVGKITSLTPSATEVSVTVEVSSGLQVPMAAHGTIIAPSLVSIRHIELSPAFSGGPTLPNGSTIPVSRTAVPVEWDEITKQLTELTTALGPNGADKHGAVGRFLTTASNNLAGEGPSLSQTLNSLNEALGTISDNRGNIFATVRNLQVFVHALASSDATVHEFTTQLDQFTTSLAGNRAQLADVVPALSMAMGDLQQFLKHHAGATEKTVADLRQLSQSMAAHRQGLADILQSAPTALSNYYNIYAQNVPAMTGVFVGANFDSPATFICSSLYSLGGTPAQCQSLLEPIAKYFASQAPPVGINPIDSNGRANPSGSTSGPSSIAPIVLPSVGSLTQLLLGGIFHGSSSGGISK